MSIAVSTFDDYTDAQRAVDRLLQAGFRRLDLHIEVDPGPPPAGPSVAQPPRHEHDRGVLASIGYAFVSILGHDNPHHEVHPYTEAARHGHSVVMVYVDNDEEAARAARVMNDRGALPGHEQRAGSWRGARGAAAGGHANAG